MNQTNFDQAQLMKVVTGTLMERLLPTSMMTHQGTATELYQQLLETGNISEEAQLEFSMVYAALQREAVISHCQIIAEVMKTLSEACGLDEVPSLSAINAAIDKGLAIFTADESPSETSEKPE